MSNESIPEFFSDLFGQKFDYSDFYELFGQRFGYSEPDIISMYIDGKIDKDEMIRRLDNVRRKKV